MWVKRYFCSPFHPWELIFEWHLEKIGGNGIFQDTYLNTDKIKLRGMTAFYNDILKAWGLFKVRPITSENVYQQSLFFNVNIKHPISQAMRHEQFMREGVTQIKDITRDN